MPQQENDMDREPAKRFEERGRPDKAGVLNIAQASLEEVRYYFILSKLSKDLGYLSAKRPVDDVEEVARMLCAYTSTVQSPSA